MPTNNKLPLQRLALILTHSTTLLSAKSIITNRKYSRNERIYSRIGGAGKQARCVFGRYADNDLSTQLCGDMLIAMFAASTPTLPASGLPRGIVTGNRELSNLLQIEIFSV